ncbi:MAG TPA: hydroxyectoine utilization dehydratase EutB [Methylomirabilota bacterium]|nr:hydroxyectoine utilization dehydratase EutB [Methylomirabilota bacterium]
MTVTLEDILAARGRIAGKVERTAMVTSRSLSARTGHPVHLKLEHRQTTGAFKLRGATNALARLGAGARARGVATASTGNHGRAVAHAARLEGVRAVVCLSRLVPANKVDEIRALGADVRIVGNSQDEAQREVERLVAEEGMTAIPPFDHADVIAGQGTIGLEMVEDAPDMSAVLVPLSGGGLIAGIAVALKALRPSARIVGISMERGAAMAASLAAGRPVAVEELPTLADSLGGGVGLDNRHTFALVRDLVDEVVLLTEPEIAAGVRHAYFEEREVLEGGGAVGLAAILARKVRPSGPTVVLLSGRNVDMAVHRDIVCGGAASQGESAP